MMRTKVSLIAGERRSTNKGRKNCNQRRRVRKAGGRAESFRSKGHIGNL